jgi:hypothetical protein
VDKDDTEQLADLREAYKGYLEAVELEPVPDNIVQLARELDGLIKSRKSD